MNEQNEATTTTNEAANNEAAEAKVYATLDEAKAAKPADKPKWHLFAVTDPAGKTSYCWSGSADTVLARVVREAGWQVHRANGASKEKAAEMLARLSPEDRAALIAQYAPAEAPKHGKKGGSK
jgi:hypothetical protein